MGSVLESIMISIVYASHNDMLGSVVIEVCSVFPASPYTSLACYCLQYTKQAMKARDMGGAGSEGTVCFS